MNSGCGCAGPRGTGEYFAAQGVGEYFASQGMGGLGEYFATRGLGADATVAPDAAGEPVAVFSEPNRKLAIVAGATVIVGLAVWAIFRMERMEFA